MYRRKIEGFRKFSYTGKAEEALEDMDDVRYEMREILGLDEEDIEPKKQLEKIEKNIETMFRYLLMEEGNRSGKISSEQMILLKLGWEAKDQSWKDSKIFQKIQKASKYFKRF